MRARRLDPNVPAPSLDGGDHAVGGTSDPVVAALLAEVERLREHVGELEDDLRALRLDRQA